LYISSENYYNKIAQNYAEVASTRFAYIERINQIITSYAKGRVKNYLDIGCGDGRRTREIIEIVKPEISMLVDTSDKMIDLVRTNVPGVSYMCIDPIAMDNSTKYDLITSLWNVIGHFPDFGYKAKFFKKIYSLLNDEGIFVFDVNNRFNIAHYGIKSVLRNYVKDMLFGSSSGFFELPIEEQKSSRVYIHKPNEVDNYLSPAKLMLIKRLYINYDTGSIEKSPYKGQLVYIIKKKN
jgi:SAM-dependent methyltransferase